LAAVIRNAAGPKPEPCITLACILVNESIPQYQLKTSVPNTRHTHVLDMVNPVVVISAKAFRQRKTVI